MKFEHTTSPSMGSDLGQMGRDGWELVAVDGPVMYWKRAVDDQMSQIHGKLVDLEAHLVALRPPGTKTSPKA